MTAATMSQAPVIPPRPTKNQDESAGSAPKIPPRPITKRFERSISPNLDRFAPSPLHEGIPPKSPRSIRFSPSNAYHEHSNDPIDRSGSVPMPSVGEEGIEYSKVNDELRAEKEKPADPEQTRTVANDLKLHAPKPSLPAHSAKQRVQQVTRTDSDRAASFGIGRPTEERGPSREGIKKKPSTSFSAGSEGRPEFDDQGIPEIGQRVPMNPHLGDVQAPSPAPGSEAPKKHHHRKHSSRGGPPGSYGMHGHGVAPQDKLDKAYYEKHPEAHEREHRTPIHDRQNDFAMSSKDLNQLVRSSASRGMGTENDYHATPTDEVAFQASEEYARITSPQPTGQRAQSFKSEITGPDGEKTIHVDDPEHPEYRSYGDENAVDDEDRGYNAPILASDEVGKHDNRYVQQPAVHPPPERSGSAFEIENPRSRPTSRSGSRSNSRPTSMYLNNQSQEFEPTSLDDVKEYEPLFKDEEKKKEKEKEKEKAKREARHHFPSKDIWEDAPNSVHYTTEVSTPDLSEQHRRKSSSAKDRPKTPAHIFAQQQEELAEREVSGHASTYLPRAEQHTKPTWGGRPGLGEKKYSHGHRFPSKDIWEDAPESHLQEVEIEQDEEESKPEEPKPEESKPEVSSRPVKFQETSEVPSLPERPKPKQTPSDEGLKTRPPVSDKPKPQIPPRPTKTGSGDSKDGDFSKPKPPVPARPVGSKIAALQAGFMSDLNKRLQLGPQAPKKEDPLPQENLAEEKEKAPLSDARKSRARGPQRRAPAKSPAAPEPETAKASVPTLSICSPQTFWSIDPEGDLSISGDSEDKDEKEEVEQAKEIPLPKRTETEEIKLAEDPKSAEEPKSVEEPEPIEPPAEEPKEEPAQEAPPKAQEEPESPGVSEAPEPKTLVANTAGESILETKVEQKGDKVEPVDVDDTPKA